MLMACPAGIMRGPSTQPRSMARIKAMRSEEHTSELQSRSDLVCRLLLEKKKIELIHLGTVFVARIVFVIVDDQCVFDIRDDLCRILIVEDSRSVNLLFYK